LSAGKLGRSLNGNLGDIAEKSGNGTANQAGGGAKSGSKGGESG